MPVAPTAEQALEGP